MRLEVSYRNIRAADALRERAERKFRKVTKHLREPIEVHVVLAAHLPLRTPLSTMLHRWIVVRGTASRVQHCGLRERLVRSIGRSSILTQRHVETWRDTPVPIA